MKYQNSSLEDHLLDHVSSLPGEWQNRETVEVDGKHIRILDSVTETSVTPQIRESFAVCSRILAAWNFVFDIRRNGIYAATPDGELVVLGCWQDQTTAFSDTASYAFLSDLDIESLHLLSLSFWSHRKFLPAVGDVGSCFDTLSGLGEIPAGFDMEPYWAMRSCNGFDAPPLAVPSWAYEAQARMCRKRTVANLLTFQTAIRQLWRHEIGHIALGHASLRPKFISRVKTDLPPKLGWACEFAADSFATTKNQSGDELPNTNFAIDFIGSLIPLLLSHGSFALLQKNAGVEDPDHPPIYARVHLLIDRINPNRSIPHANVIDAVLSHLSEISPLYAEWLQPVRDGEGHAAYLAMRRESELAIGPWQATFDAARLHIRGMESS